MSAQQSQSTNATKLVKKLVLKGILKVKTGLHIGAGRDAAKIGGLDNPVIRAALRDNQPYIPGSSLKGKIRSLLELVEGVNCLENNHNTNGNCKICKIFGGSAANKQNHASRVIFRDAYLTSESAELLKNADLDYPYTETKTETAIDRILGNAKKGTLRETERIPAGTEFCVEIVVNVMKGQNEPTDKELKEKLALGVRLLNSDYLGGSGSRGYGQVEIKFYDVDVVFVNPNSRDKNEQNAEDNRKNGDQIESQESKSPENKPAVSDDKTEEEIKKETRDLWRSALEDAGLWIDSEKDKCNEN
ncbi:MAG: type III-A CRISPR-associated RAMP protein Csm3 [Chlorobi bacterium]|nr:type III-A CRISPR-associated RAMP protein Csm3 [Chlorobiota bacterium]